MQLAALMNVKPGSKFSLHIPKRRLTDLTIKSNAEEMVLIALKNRPELREVGYQERINVQEAKAAILEILPGASVYAGTNYDSNDFLQNSNWISYGAKIGWNLMRVFAYPARKGAVDAKDKVLDARALATTMAVMTQVHVSRLRHYHAHDAFHSAQKINRIQHAILRQLKSAVRAGSVSEQTLIREEMNTLVSAVRRDIARVRTILREKQRAGAEG